MKILITGATGLVGSELVPKLIQNGHSLVIISRNSESARSKLKINAEYVSIDLSKTVLNKEVFNGVEAIVNLAGETIDGYWTESKRKLIFDSRITASQNLLQNLQSSVKTIITASAVGYYGDVEDQLVNELSPKGAGFLADICQKWEDAFKSKVSSQRLVILRFGVVMSAKGGALKKMISIFQKNLGAILGNGKQWISFISLDDLVNIMVNSVENENYSGVINAVNENPIQNEQLTNLLAKKLNKITLPNAPKFMIKLLMGEMSSLVLYSSKVASEKLKSLGYKFKHKSLQEILEQEIN